MRNLLASVLTLVLVLSFSINAQEKSSDKKHDHSGHKSETVKSAKQASESTAAVNTVCPVSGEELEDNDYTIKYEGKTYAVCCKKCLAKIEKDPEKYISRLSDDGKSLKKK